MNGGVDDVGLVDSRTALLLMGSEKKKVKGVVCKVEKWIPFEKAMPTSFYFFFCDSLPACLLLDNLE